VACTGNLVDEGDEIGIVWGRDVASYIMILYSKRKLVIVMAEALIEIIGVAIRLPWWSNSDQHQAIPNHGSS
jgi:hypothetical protein